MSDNYSNIDDGFSKLLQRIDLRVYGNSINFDKLMEQMGRCEYCGDGIPKAQMKEHHEWCKPMIERNTLSNNGKGDKE